MGVKFMNWNLEGYIRNIQ